MKGHCAPTPKDNSGQQREAASDWKAQTLNTGFGLGVSNQDEKPNCAHCIGRSERPPAPLSESAVNQQNSNAGVEAPRALPAIALPPVSFVKEIIPYEVGPPDSVQRHVLISVFLI